MESLLNLQTVQLGFRSLVRLLKMKQLEMLRKQHFGRLCELPTNFLATLHDRFTSLENATIATEDYDVLFCCTLGRCRYVLGNGWNMQSPESSYGLCHFSIVLRKKYIFCLGLCFKGFKNKYSIFLDFPPLGIWNYYMCDL